MFHYGIQIIGNLQFSEDSQCICMAVRLPMLMLILRGPQVLQFSKLDKFH